MYLINMECEFKGCHNKRQGESPWCTSHKRQHEIGNGMRPLKKMPRTNHPYCCVYCGERFLKLKHLDSHMLECKNIDGNPEVVEAGGPDRHLLM